MDEPNGGSYAGPVVGPGEYDEDRLDEEEDQDETGSNRDVKEDFEEDDPATVKDGDDTKVQLPEGGY
jgi:hypothetical protein